MIDDEDYELASKYEWSVHRVRGKIVGVRSWDTAQQKTVSIQNIIMGNCNKYDHKDRDPLNNQRDNLRLASSSQNGANRAKWSETTYKGVHWYGSRNCWNAQITKNYRRINLGYFDSEEDAARAYDQAALKYFGEFATLNFPKGDATDGTLQKV